MAESKLLRNIASEIPEDELRNLGHEIVEKYDQDINDRRKWETKAKGWLKLWACDVSGRTLPYEDASNICMPVLPAAVSQYHGRLFSSIVNVPQMMIALPVEYNDINRAVAVQKYMNYQIANEITDWKKSLDTLLQRLTIYGACFRKLFWDKFTKSIKAITISPFDLVVPTNTLDLKTAERITHRIVLSPSALQDRFDSGEFFGEYVISDLLKKNKNNNDGILSPNSPDDLSPGRMTSNEITGLDTDFSENPEHDLLSHHVKLMLLGDEKRKPYTVLVHRVSKKIFSITSRLLKNGKKDVELMNFVSYGLIPDPEGFYGHGLGHWVEQINVAINTAYNQEFDSGTMRNMPFGFYSNNLGRRGRNKIDISPGAMNEVSNPRDVYFPQMQRGDGTLFNLITMATNFADKFTANSDFLSGMESPGSRTTARGTLALIEQGLQTFSTVAQRIHLSLQEELELIFTLNSLFLDEKKQFRVTNNYEKIRLPWPEIKKKDFSGKLDLFIGADPRSSNQALKMQEIVDFSSIVGTDPLVAGDKAGREPNRKAQLEILREKVLAFGKDPDRYIPDNINKVIDPVDENSLMAQGDMVPVLPQNNHPIHIETHDSFVNGEMGANIDQKFKPLFIEHQQEHQRNIEGQQVQTNLDENVDEIGNIPQQGEI